MWFSLTTVWLLTAGQTFRGGRVYRLNWAEWDRHQPHNPQTHAVNQQWNYSPCAAMCAVLKHHKVRCYIWPSEELLYCGTLCTWTRLQYHMICCKLITNKGLSLPHDKATMHRRPIIKLTGDPEMAHTQINLCVYCLNINGTRVIII